MTRLISFIAALLVAAGLFGLMNSMIEQRVKRVENNPVRVINFSMRETDDKITTISRPTRSEPPEPPQPDQLPREISRPKNKVALPQITPISFKTAFLGVALSPWLSLPASTLLQGVGAPGASGGPMVMIEPSYPQAAKRKGIEGHVTLRYDISKWGKPINVEVVSAEPRGVFERAAKRALKKWKYRVREVDGQLEMIPKQKVTLTFELDNLQT